MSARRPCPVSPSPPLAVSLQRLSPNKKFAGPHPLPGLFWDRGARLGPSASPPADPRVPLSPHALSRPLSLRTLGARDPGACAPAPTAAAPGSARDRPACSRELLRTCARAHALPRLARQLVTSRRLDPADWTASAGTRSVAGVGGAQLLSSQPASLTKTSRRHGNCAQSPWPPERFGWLL